MSKINNYNSKLHIAKVNKNVRNKDLHLLGDEHHDLQVGGELHGGQPALHRPHLLHIRGHILLDLIGHLKYFYNLELTYKIRMMLIRFLFQQSIRH